MEVIETPQHSSNSHGHALLLALTSLVSQAGNILAAFKNTFGKGMFQRKHHVPPTSPDHSPGDDLKETFPNNIYFGKQLNLPKTNKTSAFTEIIT